MPAPENDPNFTIQRLNQKINADQVEFARMQDDCEKMQAALERKKASEQLAAWAIDRAIETRKAGGQPVTSADVIADAAAYTDWIATFKHDAAQPAETIQ